jgi:hypothetical protein
LKHKIANGKYHCKLCRKTVKSYGNHIKSKSHLLKAGGLISWFKDKYKQVKNTITDKFRKKLDGFNATSTSTLKKYGNFPIVAVKIVKQPIHKIIDLFINALSLGKFNELKQKYGFDDMYHLGCIASVKLPNGSLKEIQFEKVESVKFHENITISGKDVEFMTVPIIDKNITLDEMTYKARQAVGDKTYFDYDGFTNNCQWFIRMNLMNGLNVWNDKINSFVMQDVNEFAKDMPQYAKDTMNVITDIGQIADNVAGGNLVIHRVNVSKDVPFDEALKHAQNIIKTKRKFKQKLVKNYWHFKSKPQTHFKKGTFRSKKINSNITIVLGELK